MNTFYKLLAIAVLMLGSTMGGKAFNVTFRVDMSQQSGYTTAQVNGTFNGWCGACFSLTDADGDQIWEGTANIAAGSYEYKFTADNWALQESLIPGSSCTMTTGNFTNRTLVVTGDVVLPVVCWGACVDCASAPAFYDVTFQVDMNGQTGFTTPEVNGSFNGWCGSCNPLADANGDGIWSTTITLQQGNYEYKFSYDNWAGQESLPVGSPCTMTTGNFTNRVLTLTQDVVLNPVCFGSCAACGVNTGPFNVTFSLDMSEVGFAFGTPEINGEFNNWCGNCAAMSDLNGDNIWTLTIPLQAGSYEYKFSYDNWAGQESLAAGSTCTSTLDGFTNRVIEVSGPSELGTVCWESCAACGIQPVYYNVEFQVDMQNVTGVTSVEIISDFNGWCSNCLVLSDDNADGIWTGTASLEAGSYEFKYTYNGGTVVETLAEGSACTITTGAFTNRSLTVTGDVSLNPVCWESCASCEGVIQTFQMALPVTFDAPLVEYGLLGFDGSEDATIVVDPTDASNQVARVVKSATAGASSGVTITAPAQLGFSSAVPFTVDSTTMSVRVWSPDAGIQVRLKVEDHTNPTHSVETNVMTTVANEWETLVFDFANQSAGTAALNLGYVYDKASIFFNFGVDGATAGEKTYYFDDVAFGGETAQVVEYAVTFQVDMQNVTGFTTAEVSGSFNEWCGGCFPLNDDDGDGIWSGTAMLPEGIYEYKFVYDSWTGQENLLPGLPCTVTNFGFTNRALEVGSDVILPVVCWESCTDCASAPVTHDVTFRVDMNGVAGFTTPEVNGTFNNWCGSCFQMSDMDGDGIWEATTTLQEVSYEFKYSYDNWAGSEQLTSGDPCTVSNGAFVNRSLNLQSDTILSVVCWASCDPCSAPEPVQVTLNVDLAGLTASSVEVTGTFNNYCDGCNPMTALGNNQYSITLDVTPGVHYYQFTTDGGTVVENLVEGTCTVGFKFGVVRELIVSEAVNVGMVCWESCEACPTAVNEWMTSSVAVYPNPANTMVQIALNDFMQAEYRIVDATGRVVATGKTNGQSRVDISTENMSEGFYQVIVNDGAHSVSSKLIIQH